MIKPVRTTITRDVHLLEEVEVTHVSLVDRPANRQAFRIVKQAIQKSIKRLDIVIDTERKAWDSVAKLDKVATPKEDAPNANVKRKGKWVTNKAGKRFFIPERTARTRDASGAKQLPRQFRKLPDKTVKRPAVN